MPFALCPMHFRPETRNPYLMTRNPQPATSFFLSLCAWLSAPCLFILKPSVTLIFLQLHMIRDDHRLNDDFLER
jgi:hypothetical protein